MHSHESNTTVAVPSNLTIGNTLTPNEFKAIVAPFSYGVELGLVWALKAYPLTLKDSAAFPTADAQLWKHVQQAGDYTGTEQYEGRGVVGPDCRSDAPMDRVNFFAWAKATHAVFQGDAPETDRDFYYDNDSDCMYYIPGVPNHAFRQFELGWSKAVREVSVATAKCPKLEP